MSVRPQQATELTSVREVSGRTQAEPKVLQIKVVFEKLLTEVQEKPPSTFSLGTQ